MDSILSDSDLDHDERVELVSHVATDCRLSNMSKNSKSNSSRSLPRRKSSRKASAIQNKSGVIPKHGLVSASFRRMSTAAVEIMADTSSALTDFTHGLHEFGHEIARGLPRMR